MKLPSIETLQYWNQWTMIGYRIVAGLSMIPVAWAAWLAVKCARKYLASG